MNVKYKDKKINTIVNKIKLTEEQAIWCKKKNKKYCIWIANQVKDYNLDIKDSNVSDSFSKILEWKKSAQNVNLNNLNYKQAVDKFNKYYNSLFVNNENSLKNKRVILDCGDYKWVELVEKKDFIEEGEAMLHCIAGYFNKRKTKQIKVFSLRDKYNKPKLTLSSNIDNNGKFTEIREFKGISNINVKEKYFSYFFELHKKFKFNNLLDSFGTILKDIDFVEKCLEVNDNFLSTKNKLKYGILSSVENIIIDKCEINTKRNEFKLKNGLKCYSSLILDSKKNITIEDNVLIGGNLKIYCEKLNILGTLKVAGNVEIETTENISENDFKKIQCFGEIDYTKKEEEELA